MCPGPWKVVDVGGGVREGCPEEEGTSSSFQDKQEMQVSVFR